MKTYKIYYGIVMLGTVKATNKREATALADSKFAVWNRIKI